MEVMGIRLRPVNKDQASQEEEEVKSQEQPQENNEEMVEGMLSKTLTQGERVEYKQMLLDFPNLFVKDYINVRGVDIVQHQIELKPESQPRAQKLQKLGVVKEEALLKEKVEEGLQRLNGFGGQLNPDKCHIGEDEIILLGHKISQRRSEVDLAKTKALLELPSPKSIKEVMSFMQKVKYMARFIHLTSELLHPLQKLTQQMEFTWSEDLEEYFKSIKMVIKVPNVWPLPPPPPEVLSNAYTLFFDGAFSRATEKAGGDPKGEMVMKEQVNLDGSTSNNEVEYDVLISGLKICLSQKIRRPMVKGDTLLIVKQILGVWACKNERLRTKVTTIRKLFSQFEEVRLYHISRKENEDADLLAQQAISNQDKAHVVIAAKALKDLQYVGMESLTHVVNYILEGEFPREFTTGQRRKLIKEASTFLWLERALYQKGKELVCRRIPSTGEIPKILKGLHEEACGGDFSHELTLKEGLLARYVWPSMHADVQHWCRRCHNCQVNGNKRLLYGPQQTVIANDPFEKWGIDAMGPLPRTTNGKLYILVAIDYMTRRVEAQSVARVNGKQTTGLSTLKFVVGLALLLRLSLIMVQGLEKVS
ncbi:hypothetical protein L7F22_005150 [Adiantum nelumboides]|nr:hypothetical protein [Adiantum nelumboides]